MLNRRLSLLVKRTGRMFVRNEFHFSDVYRSVNYIRSLAKETLLAIECSLHFEKHQEN